MINSRQAATQPWLHCVCLVLWGLVTVPLYAQSADPVMATRGQLKAAQFTTLSSGIARQITRIEVQTGSVFKLGAVLVSFDCREESADQDIIEARLQAARTRLEVNQRLEALDSVSTLEVDLTRAELAIAEAELRKISAILDKCEIRAPFAGSVLEKSAQAFQFVGVGEPLLRIVNPDSLEIEAILPSSALGWIKPGQPFTMRLDETGDLVSAQVDRLVGEVDPVSQTLRIFGKLVDMPTGLLPGMSGLLQFESPR